jgi:type I restriction enzyme S subunit
MSTKIVDALAQSDFLADDDLPEGWAHATLGEISEGIQYGYTASASRKKGPRFLRITDIQDGRVDWASVPSCEIGNDDAEKYGLKPGDIVFARTGATTGKSFLIASCPPAVFASYLIRVRACQLVDPFFLSQYFNTRYYWDFIRENIAGNAQPNCNGSKLSKLPVIVAPLPEQKRIVAKIEELLAQVNAIRARLAKVAQILKRFRQSVLAAAFSEGDSIALSEIVLDVKYGTAQKCTPMPTGSPVLRIPNIGDGSIRLNDLKYAKLPSRELAALRLLPGDILMIRSNGSVSLVGKTALVSQKEAGFAYAGYLIRLRVDVDRVLPEYLNSALQTHAVREQIEIPARSTSGVHNINSTELLRLEIHLPELERQKTIVHRVEALFRLADAIEKRVGAATKRADKLTQAILAKAFRGELVPTEAELARREGRYYETATVLLERVRTERACVPEDAEYGRRPKQARIRRHEAWSQKRPPDTRVSTP